MLRKMPSAPKKLALAISLIGSNALIHANAQDDEDLRLEEIIVTSQKRAESLQDVPISVATITGEKLADAGIENLEDLTAYLPNIHFTESGFSTQVRVRGIGSDNSQGFEQSVGMYMDGIYYGRAQLFRTPMMDMQRAELLRGPQSTLFGKNSISGALNLTTARPTEEFEGSLSVSHEFEHNQNEVNAVVSGPISDNLRARLAIRTYEEDGYYFNTHKNLEEPKSEDEAYRLTLDWTPTDSLSFLFKAEKNEFDTQGRAIEITRDVPLTAGGRTYSSTLSLLSSPTFESNLDYNRQSDIPEFSKNDISNFTLTTNYEFNDHTLTLVTGLLEFDYTELCDCDFTNAEVLELELAEDYEQFSQEIRITSPVGEEFEWIAGAFYQDYDQEFVDDLFLRSTNLLPQISAALAPIADTAVDRDFTQSSEAWALFGRVTWNISSELHVTLGARYTQEDKEATKRIQLYVPSTGELVTNPLVGTVYLQAFGLETEQGVINPATGLAYEDAGHNISGQRDESAFNPLINIEWDVTGDSMAYATFTTGFKAGGYDPRSNSVGNFASTVDREETNPTRFFEFEEEEAVALEVGLKTSLADGRGELNLALYRTDYDDLQISQFDGAVGFNVGNAKETRVQGLEVDGRWLLVEGLTASYGLSLLDFEYLDFKNGNCYAGQTPDNDLDGDGTNDTCDYTGKRGVYTPDYSVNLGLEYYTPLTSKIDFIGFIDIQQVDEHNVHNNLDPEGVIDAYTIVNARVGIEGANWSVAVLGKNLADEEVITYSSGAPLSDSNFNANTFYSFVRRPMTVALEAAIKF